MVRTIWSAVRRMRLTPVLAGVFEGGEAKRAAHAIVCYLVAFAVVDDGLVASVGGADVTRDGVGRDDVAKDLAELCRGREGVDHGAIVRAAEVEENHLSC